MYIYVGYQQNSKITLSGTTFKCVRTLVQKSYCYTPRVSVGVCIQNVRANVKVFKLKPFCVSVCSLTLLIILIKPITTRAYDRHASGDCGTSGCNIT